VSKPLFYIINRCFECGEFPSQLKTARVTPIPKKGDITDANNYRPIAVLSVFSKLLESLFHYRLKIHLDTHEILSNNQHGFRTNRSTTTATYNLLKPVYNAITNKEQAVCTFFDYTKAFDSLDHNTLFKKCESYGITGKALSFIKSFLAERQQIVTYRYTANMSVDIIKSKPLPINIGVPQGAVLSPTLFAIYANDLPQAIDKGVTTQFADDTSNTITGHSRRALKEEASNAVEQISNWSRQNKLMLNVSKTMLLYFEPKNNQSNIPFDLSIDNNDILASTHLTFLGLEIDSNLEFNKHVEKITPKINRAIFLLRKLSYEVAESELKIAYYGTIYPHIKFNIIFWGASKFSKRIFSLQKDALKAMFHIHRHQSCRDVFKKHSILPLPSIYILEAANFIWSNIEKFQKNAEIHSHNTRKKHRLHPPKNIRCFEYPLIAIFNKLPDYIKELKTRNAFNRATKNLLLKHQFYSISDYHQAKLQ
jgi:hypothetical protein